jgi:hypothetical protein
MSAEEERQAKAMVLLEYAESKQRLALLKAQADKLAAEFEALAKLLRSDLQNISVASYSSIFDYSKFNDLVADVAKTFNETSRLKETVHQLGLSVDSNCPAR